MGGHDHMAAVAQVLRDMGGEIEALGLVLCSDPALAGRHARELQAIDLIAQMQQALSSLLVADCLNCALEQVRIDSLRERLRVCLPDAPCGHAA